MRIRQITALMAAAVLLAGLPFPAARSDAGPVTVSVFRGDPGSQPTSDNKIYRLIEQELGLRFDFEFTSGDLDAAIGNILMSGKYPDLFDGSNDAEILIDSGALIDLLPYISAEGTPNLYQHLYTNDRISQLLSDDGKLYIIPNYGIFDNDQIVNESYGPAFLIQKQVIAWNEYRVPTTLNEYFDLIERYVAANPTAADGTPYTGFELMCDDWRNFGLLNPVQFLMGRPNDGEVLINPDNYHTETFINQDYAKGYYEKLNEAYGKGLVGADSFSIDYSEYISKLSSGTVLGVFDQVWNISVATSALKNAGMDENTYLSIPLVYDPEYVNGQMIEEHYLNGSAINKNRGFGISTSCDNPQVLVQLFETLLSDEWQTLLQWGVEGEDYYIDETGRMRMTPEQYAHLNDAEWLLANKAEALFQSTPKKQGTMDNGNAWNPAEQPENYFGLMNEYDQQFYASLGVTTPGELFNAPIELAPYGEAWQIDLMDVIDMNDEFLGIQIDSLPQLITCDPDEFNEKWDDFVADVSPSAAVITRYLQQKIYEIVGVDAPARDKTLYLPDDLRVIEAGAFQGIRNAEIHIPSGVETIGANAFDATALLVVHDNPDLFDWLQTQGYEVAVPGN